MARIRTVKPELWAHEGLAKCSRDARLLFVALFNVVDDEGRSRAAPLFLHGACFPYDEDLNVASLLDELEDGDHIRRYASEDGQRYLFIPSFSIHQKIDHPTKSRIQAPPLDILAKGSRKARERLAPDLGREGKGREEDQLTCPPAERPAVEPPAPRLLIERQPQTPFEAYLMAEFPTANIDSILEQAWSDSYPGLDLLAEAKKARAWEVSNPRQAKKQKRAFLRNWFETADRKRPVAAGNRAPRNAPWVDAQTVKDNAERDRAQAARDLQAKEQRSREAKAAEYARIEAANRLEREQAKAEGDIERALLAQGA